MSAELLQAIGKRYYEEIALAPPLHSEIAVRSKDVIQKGLTRKLRLQQPEKINQKIKTVVQHDIINSAARIILKQQKITAGLSAIAKVITMIIKDGVKEEAQMLEHLSNTIKILADLQRESKIRRSLIIVNINVALTYILINTKCEEYLFGEKLDEIIKSAKALEDTAKDLKV